ncbi:MAG: class I SAM-dependent methyltransferase [Acidimicrobiales bacterium]
MGSREQRLVFGEDPELYDQARPGYADAVVDSVLAYGGIAPARCEAVEIGAGTGKATEAFAARGIRIRAIEPDPAMARVGARRCASYPEVSFHQSSFEEWVGAAHSVDLVFSGQAWHWVRPEVRAKKAANLLRTPGTLACMWHRMEWADDDPLRAELLECYRATAPELLARRPSFPGVNRTDAAGDEGEEITGSGCFTDVAVRHHRWREELSGDALVARLATQSDHRLAPEAVRRAVFGELRRIVAAHGGVISLHQDTVLVLGRPAK